MNMDNELLELCKEVFEATDWQPTGYFDGDYIVTQEDVDAGGYDDIQLKRLYTSDYLLEKLLPETSIRFIPQANGQIYLQWWPTEPNYDDIFASTPLKALLKLTLTLNKIAGKQY